MEQESRRMAVLIDGDSIDPALLGRVLGQAGQYGALKIRRIYGGREKLDSWKGCIENHGIEAVPNDARYKNAADTMLIIDAVDILRRDEIDGFCIVSNDNDFAGLARYMRGQKSYVAGIGSKSTPPLDLECECEDFTYVEDLPALDNPDPAAWRRLSAWKVEVRVAVSDSARTDGWAHLSDVGGRLQEAGSAAYYREYCHDGLLSMVESCPEFEVEYGRVRLRNERNS